MRLYPKALRNIDALEKEKKRLLKESQRMEEQDFLSLEGIFQGKKGAGKKDAGDAEFSLLDYLPISNPVINLLVKKAASWFSERKSTAKNKEKEQDPTEGKTGKSKLESLAFEFIGGYLKWKAIELSFKGARYLIRKKKEKKSA